ncbi:hypothetical protein LBMAG42_44800 [Deltaproteobacteria bacterium]|nr:hypothetical protein LBMAG42_44800 [Deltaproteobacteria bacterium]
MFDSVARNPREGGARKGAALVLTMIASAAVVGALVSVRAPVVVERSVVDYIYFPSDPVLPPAPTPAGGGAQARRSTPKKVEAREEVAPAAPVAEVTPIVAEVPEVPPTNEAAVVIEGDPNQGDPEGRGTGPGRGPGIRKGDGPGGRGEGSGGGGLRTINAHEALPRVRAEPEWPRAALAVGLTEGRCVVHVVIDEGGAPADVSFRDCPVVFQRATREAALQWRWYPVLDGERPVAAQFDIAFLFRR